MTVGIEMRRARDGRVRWQLHRFPDGPQSGSPGTRRFRKPPYDPGRRDFPGPVLTLAFLHGSSRYRGEAQALTYVHPACAGLPTNSSPASRVAGSSAQGPRATLGPPSAQSPFAARRRYRHAGGVQRPLVEHYFHFIAPTGSCAEPPHSCRLRHRLLAPGLCRLLSAPAARRFFPTLSLPILPRVSGPLLRLLPRCTCPLLPPGQWPSPS
jgi:hypothetical protein